MTQRLQVEIWSDIACPWCYVGKRRFEAALAQFRERTSVEIRWRAFELDPAAPREKDPSLSYAERLAHKYAAPLDRAEGMIRTMTEAAAAEGLEFRFDRIRPGNTFDAHRLLRFAAERGQADAAQERLSRAYMTEGVPIGDREVLAQLAAEIGLDAGEARTLLSGDAYANEVRADESEARDRGISAVPFFLIGRYGAGGAQPADVLLRVLEAAWGELPAPHSGRAPDEGEACDPEGCG